MKRLLAQIGITAFSALAVAFYLPLAARVALLCAAAAAGAVLTVVKRTRRTVFVPAIAFTVAVACAVNLLFTAVAVTPVQEDFSGSGRRVEAVLSDEAYRSYSKYYYRLRTASIDGVSADTHLLLKTSVPISAEPFDRLSFVADISPTENKYYLSKGYYISVDTYDRDFEVTGSDGQGLYYYAIKLRQALRKAFDEYLPDDVASLCKTVFVGDKYALGDDLKADFRYAGASYFVVVSGMHFSIICMMLMLLLRKLLVNRYASFALTLLTVLVYMAVTGFQPSVMRSGVMILMLLLSRLFRRENSPHNSLGIAGLILPFIFSPYGMGDVGLILSYAATFAIITWHVPIYDRIRIKNADNLAKRAVNVVLNLMTVSIAANITVFPISVFVFGAFSMVTFISALVLYIPIWLILVLSVFLCLFFYLGPLRYISLLLSWPLYALGRFVLAVVQWLASLPFSYVYIGDAFVYVWLTLSIVLGAIVFFPKKGRRFLPIAALISAIVLLSGVLVAQFVSLNTVELEAYDCGEGIAVGFNNRGAYYMLSFDARSKEAYGLLDDLTRSYGSAELAVCSKRSDRYNYSRLTDKEFAISHVLLYDDSVDDPDDIMSPDDDGVYILGEGAELRTASYNGKILSRLTYGDTTVTVIPNNYPYKKIPEEYRAADIIVMRSYREGYEGLTCGELIISDTADAAPATADAMAGTCVSVAYTCGGDVKIDLR